MYKKGLFNSLSKKASRATGHPLSFIAAVLLILAWLISGPLFNYNDTWQLVINTTTTIITFLMVFLIQGSQNHDAEAVQLKLDELIRALDGAHNALLNIEDLTQQDLDRLKNAYLRLAQEARSSVQEGRADLRPSELFSKEDPMFQKDKNP